MRLSTVLSFGLAAGLASSALASEPSPVPATRTQMKQTLEGSKHSRPRLPLPPPTEAEKAEAAKQGGWGIVNNARMRKLYLPPELAGGGFPRPATTPAQPGRAGLPLLREVDPAMSLDPVFKTMFFWIVSRSNNCYYCMGHQETKLSSAGVAEDKIAALDGDWSEFTPAERAAFALTRKLTFEPHAIRDADVDALRRYYTDLQILEIVFTVAGNNATNRWTGALAIPQEEHRVYLTPTSEKYRDLRSLVAPLNPEQTTSTPACAVEAKRPPQESRAEVEAALSAARTRTPRLPLASEEKARSVLPSGWSEGPLPGWVRLLANFPRSGVLRITLHRAAEEKGSLDARLKAEIAWIAARHDRAWYALDQARRQLKAVGLTDDAIFALDGSWEAYSPAERAVFSLTRKLTVDPALVADEDIEALRKHYSDKQVAEVVFLITEAAFFDRLTEASGLPLDRQ